MFCMIYDINKMTSISTIHYCKYTSHDDVTPPPHSLLRTKIHIIPDLRLTTTTTTKNQQQQRQQNKIKIKRRRRTNEMFRALCVMGRCNKPFLPLHDLSPLISEASSRYLRDFGWQWKKGKASSHFLFTLCM